MECATVWWCCDTRIRLMIVQHSEGVTGPSSSHMEWVVVCPGPGLSAGKSGEICGHGSPRFFLPSTSACLIAVTESLCVGRIRKATFAPAYPLGVLRVRVSNAGVICWSGVGSREGQMISPSLVGPGSTEVLEPNLRHEPGLTHARTDSQHVRGPSPPLVGFL